MTESTDDRVSPIGLHLELIENPNQPEDVSAEADGHIERESRVCSADDFAINKVSCQASCKGCTEDVNTETNPSIQIPGGSSSPGVMVNPLQRFNSEGLLSIIRSDRNFCSCSTSPYGWRSHWKSYQGHELQHYSVRVMEILHCWENKNK